VTTVGKELAMVRFLVLYPMPVNAELFDSHYFKVHVPMVKRFSKLRRYTVSRNPTPVRGQAATHLVAELDWDDIDSLHQDFESEAGHEAARDAAILVNLCPGMHSMTYEIETL
jgi:uncharacterized protein (TIGR02118 family)